MENFSACLGLMADIEDSINAMPEEQRELFWLVLKGDLLRFRALLADPSILPRYCEGGIEFAKQLEP